MSFVVYARRMDLITAVTRLEKLCGPTGPNAAALGTVLAELGLTREAHVNLANAAGELLELLDGTDVYRDERIGHAGDRVDQLVHRDIPSIPA
jgi:nucleoside diphosphate kinase